MLESICDVYRDDILYHDNRENAVLEENGRKYYAKNPDGKMLAAFQVDGGIIKSKSEKKCDKALVVGEEKMYLVELKGKDMNTACEQLISSYDYFHSAFSQYEYFCRIVLSEAPRSKKHIAPNMISNSQRRLEAKINYKDNKERLKYASMVLKENV